MANPVLELRLDESTLADASVARVHRADLPRLSPGTLAGPVRRAALEAWENRTRAEYEGMALARRFHGYTVELNAPMDIQELALKMTLQEQQHARYCMAAARSLGSGGRLAFEAARLGYGEPAAHPYEAFWKMVCGPFAVSEVAAFRLLSASIRMLPPSGFRDILTAILKDEALHSRIGFLILSQARLPRRQRRPDWIEAPSEPWIRDFANRFIAAGLERSVIDSAEAALFENSSHRKSLLALGIPPSLDFKSSYLDALRKDVPRRFRAIGIVL